MDFGFFSIGGGRGGSLLLPVTVDSVSVSSASTSSSSLGRLDPLGDGIFGRDLGEVLGLSGWRVLQNVSRVRDDRGDWVGVVLI